MQATMVGELAVDARKVALSKEQCLFVLKGSGELIGVASQVAFLRARPPCAALCSASSASNRCLLVVCHSVLVMSSRSMCVNNRFN